MKGFLAVIFGNGRAARRPIDPDIAATLLQVREQKHEIANKATVSHALVRNHRSIATADAALRAVRGEEE